MGGRKFSSLSTIKKQQGVVLFVALIVLLIISLLGVSSLRVGLVEERMSFNSQISNVSFQAAETAIAAIYNNLETNDQVILSTDGGKTAVFCVNRGGIAGGDDCDTAFLDAAQGDTGTIQSWSRTEEVSKQLVADSDIGSFVDYQFKVVGYGQIPGLDVAASNEQYLLKRAPGTGGANYDESY